MIQKPPAPAIKISMKRPAKLFRCSVAHLLNPGLDVVFVDTTSACWECSVADEFAELVDRPQTTRSVQEENAALGCVAPEGNLRGSLIAGGARDREVYDLGDSLILS